VSVLRNLSWLAGLSCPVEDLGAAEAHTPALVRHCRTGKKRLRRVTRVLLSYIPYRLQSVLGYPVPSSIGKTAVSEEVRCSPTKPSGKGNKRKQEDVDEEEHQSWVEALNKELGDEDSEGDPTYEPSSDGESDSEENRTRNDTESDIEEVAEEGKAIIKELDAAKKASTENRQLPKVSRSPKWLPSIGGKENSLKGARVLVTGASTGIGEQMAYHYARFGAQVVITARRGAVLKQVAEKCLKLGAEKALYIAADMAEPTDPDRVIKFAAKSLGEY
ncbi:Hydroxysteroid 11-beta-dehydrogenase 1-like protein, partial [Acipenser ruthenus]